MRLQSLCSLQSAYPPAGIARTEAPTPENSLNLLRELTATQFQLKHHDRRAPCRCLWRRGAAAQARRFKLQHRLRFNTGAVEVGAVIISSQAPPPLCTLQPPTWLESTPHITRMSDCVFTWCCLRRRTHDVRTHDVRHPTATLVNDIQKFRGATSSTTSTPTTS